MKEFTKSELSNFDENSILENTIAHANVMRGNFLKRFPLTTLSSMTLEEYAIGNPNNTDSFCVWVERRTGNWANTTSSTPNKFGVYFDKKANKYIASKKFGGNGIQGGNYIKAFENIKTALVQLIADAKQKNFDAIDENPLSQMFKAKIISLYFPQLYINICSEEHLEYWVDTFKIISNDYNNTSPSKNQNRLVEFKDRNPITKEWSAPKFMNFIYSNYFYEKTQKTINSNAPENPSSHNPSNREFDPQSAEDAKRLIGEKSEKFALDWEKKRLIGENLPHLVKKITNRSNTPSYGYDLESFSDEDTPRYIEIKTVRPIKKNEFYRLFLTAHEEKISMQLSSNYYFYLVFYNKANEPKSVRIIKAEHFYKLATMSPHVKTVFFDPNDLIKFGILNPN